MSTCEAGGITYLAKALLSFELWPAYSSLYTSWKSSHFCPKKPLLITLDPSTDEHSMKI